jgi:hypothetical protein
MEYFSVMKKERNYVNGREMDRTRDHGSEIS